MSGQWMPLPAPPPAPRKRRVWPWVVLGIIVLLVVVSGATAENRNAPVPTFEPTPSPAGPVVVSAAEFVDLAFTDQTQREFCDAYFLVADYDLAYGAFRSGAMQEGWTDDPDMPTIREVFDELAGRC